MYHGDLGRRLVFSSSVLDVPFRAFDGHDGTASLKKVVSPLTVHESELKGVSARFHVRETALNHPFTAPVIDARLLRRKIIVLSSRVDFG